MNDLWVTALLVFIASALGTSAVALLSEGLRDWWRARQVSKRLDPVLSGRTRLPGGGDIHDLVRTEGEGDGFFNSLAARLPGFRNVGTLLEQARVELNSGTFLIISLGLGFGFGMTAWVLSSSILFFGVGAASGMVLPYLWVVSRRNRRFKQFEEEFPEGLDLLTRAIRAGHPLSAGMQMVGEEGPPEVAVEFRRAFEEQRFGIPFEEALIGIVDRTHMIDVRIFAIAVLIQREVGGNLAEILENLAETIRKRFYIRRQLRVYTAQGRLTGYVLASLPIFVGLVIFLIQPDYVLPLFQETLGQVMVGVALTLQVIGVLWIKAIVNIDI